MTWNNTTKRFVGCSLAVAGVIIVAGWLTGAKMLLNAALVAVAIVALLPFLVLALIVFLPALLLVACGILGMLFAFVAHEPLLQLGVDAAVASSGIVPWYYRLLGQQRHPHFWGTLCGLILGTGLLAVLVAILILPGETRTVQTLARTQAEIGAAYKITGSFPQPDENGHLPIAALRMQTEDRSVEGVVLDGFGRPVLYEVKGHWKMASYRLESLGYDGRPSPDDFCVAGSTKLATLANATSRLLEILGQVKGASPATMQDKLRGIQALRCSAADE